MTKLLFPAALALLLVACGAPAGETSEGSATPERTEKSTQKILAMKQAGDQHTYAIPEEAVVKHLNWNAEVNMDTRIIQATATYNIGVVADSGRFLFDIVDLDITAPDVPGNTLRDTYSDSAGSMTLDLKVSDGASGAPLLHVVDHKEDPREAYLQWRKRPNNLHQARIMVRSWARELTDLLGSREA